MQAREFGENDEIERKQLGQTTKGVELGKRIGTREKELQEEEGDRGVTLPPGPPL